MDARADEDLVLLSHIIGCPACRGPFSAVLLAAHIDGEDLRAVGERVAHHAPRPDDGPAVEELANYGAWRRLEPASPEGDGRTRKPAPVATTA